MWGEHEEYEKWERIEDTRRVCFGIELCRRVMPCHRAVIVVAYS